MTVEEIVRLEDILLVRFTHDAKKGLSRYAISPEEAAHRIKVRYLVEPSEDTPEREAHLIRSIQALPFDEAVSLLIERDLF